MLIDSHAHLNFSDFADDLDAVIARAKATGVTKIINAGASLADSKQATELAKKYDGLYAAVGIHPNDDPSITVDNVDWVELENLAKQPKVVAIGETGLDYSRIMNYELRIMDIEKRRQKELFLKQLEIAAKLNLPLIIHIRDAQNELIKLFSSVSMYQYINTGKLSGVFHCFSGDQKYLDFILRRLPGFFVSFAGNVTFPPKTRLAKGGKNAGQLQELAKLVPLGRLLLETDCPYLSPEPLRGCRNEPANVKTIAIKLAEIKNMSLEDISSIITDNTRRLFKI